MADQIKKLSAGHSIEALDAIMTEVEEARGEYDNLGERLDEMSSDTPTPSTAAPAMDGTAAAGTSTDYARADHIHPSNTSKQDTLTAAQLAAVNSGIDSEKVAQIETNKNNISKDEAALVELVDGGAKNLSDWDGGAAATDSSFVVQNEPITLKKATYAISFDTTANSGRCEIVFRDSNGVVGSYTFDNTSSSTLSAEITLTADAVKFNIFTTKAATITNFMICTKATWGISQAYQPYRPPYQELYEMVKALQAAT